MEELVDEVLDNRTREILIARRPEDGEQLAASGEPVPRDVDGDQAVGQIEGHDDGEAGLEPDHEGATRLRQTLPFLDAPSPAERQAALATAQARQSGSLRSSPLLAASLHRRR
jgi:hypothetical protein